MQKLDNSVCASCGFASRAGAKFCGGCGKPLIDRLLCPECGAPIETQHRFCSNCGSNVQTERSEQHSSVRPEPNMGGEATRGSVAVGLRMPQFAFSERLRSSHDALSRRLAPVATLLLTLGVALVFIAQAYLTLANEPDRSAPSFGIFALVTGFVLFTAGVLGRSGSNDTTDSVNIPAPRDIIGNITHSKVAALIFGAIMMGLLALRLLNDSQSGWDLLLWLLVLCAFAAPFIRRPSLSSVRAAIPRERYADLLIVLALVGIFVGLNTHDLTDWYYSAIGDEYALYNFAKGMAENGLQRPFDLDGVYGETNPVMASIYPALVMWLLGIDNFTWKFSLIISVAITIPGIYVLGYSVAGRACAFISAAALAFSHYIFAFMHIGYPNTDALPIIVWSVALFLMGVRRGSPLLIYASGALAGFGLLFNLVARAAIAVIFLYALSHSDIRRRLVSLWPWALGILLAIVPMYFVNGIEAFSGGLTKIVSPDSHHASEYEGMLGRILGNSVQNLLAFNYNSRTSHYVSGALLDPISAALATLGLGYSLGTVKRASSRMLLFAFAILATGTALLSPYPYVPITRMSAMIIPLALMSGAAAAYLLRFGFLSERGTNQRLQAGSGVAALAVLGALMLMLNARQFWYVTPLTYHHTQEATAIGAMRSDACAGELNEVVMVGRSTAPLLKPALESYHSDGAMPQLLDHANADAGNPFPIVPPRCVIFLNPDDAEIQPFKQDLVNRYQSGEFRVFAIPSNKAAVEIFLPNVVPNAD